jgi:hypothetical protein
MILVNNVLDKLAPGDRNLYVVIIKKIIKQSVGILYIFVVVMQVWYALVEDVAKSLVFAYKMEIFVVVKLHVLPSMNNVVLIPIVDI